MMSTIDSDSVRGVGGSFEEKIALKKGQLRIQMSSNSSMLIFVPIAEIWYFFILIKAVLINLHKL